MSIADDVYKAIIKKVPNAVRKYGAEALGSAILQASRKDSTDIEKLADAVIKSLKPKTNEEKNKPTLTDAEEKQILSKLLKVFNSVSSPEQLKSAKKYHSLSLKKLSAKSLDEFYRERGEIGDLALKISSVINNKEKKYTPVGEGQIYSTGGGAGQSYRKFTPKVDKTLDEDWGSSDWTAALKDFKRDLSHVKNADDIADSAYSIASSFNEPRKYSDDPWTSFTPKRLLDMALRREIVPKELISTVQGILSGKVQVRIAHELDEEVLINRLSQESSVMKGLVSENKCPKCGGPLVSEEMLHEKKDACYYKVKSRYKVWPSAYASGALVKCRKKSAKNWGKKSVKENKGLPMPGTYEQEYNMCKSKGPERIIAMTNEGDKDVAEGSLNESDKFTSWYDWKDQAKSSGYTITKKDDKIVALNKQGQVVGHWSDVGKFLSGKAPRPNFKRPVEQGVAEGKKRKKKKTSRSLGRYFFPGYGYYGSGESGESGSGDGGGGESVSRGVTEGSKKVKSPVQQFFVESLNSDAAVIEYVNTSLIPEMRKYNVPVSPENHFTRISSAIFEGVSSVIDSGKDFLETFKRLDQRKKMKIAVGQEVSILNLRMSYDFAELFGFKTPKQITKIYREPTDNKIVQLEFNNDPEDVWPRKPLASFNGKLIITSAFFPNATEMEKSLTALKLATPENIKVRTNISEGEVVPFGIPNTEELKNLASEWHAYTNLEDGPEQERIENELSKKGYSIEYGDDGTIIELMHNRTGRKILVPADDALNENLHKWFKEKWVRFGPDGKIRGDCARGSDSEGKPKCLPQKKAQSLGKEGRASAAARKRRQDPNPERSGKAKNVATKKKK